MVEYTSMVSRSFSYARKSAFTKLLFGYYFIMLVLILGILFALSSIISADAIAVGAFTSVELIDIGFALLFIALIWLVGMFLVTGQIIHANSFLDKKQLSLTNSLRKVKQVFLPVLGAVIVVSLIQLFLGNAVSFVGELFGENANAAIVFSLLNVLVSALCALIFMYTMYCAVFGKNVVDSLTKGFELFKKNKLVSLISLVIGSLIALVIILIGAIPFGLLVGLFIALSEVDISSAVLVIGFLLALVALAAFCLAIVFYQTFILSVYRSLLKGRK